MTFTPPQSTSLFDPVTYLAVAGIQLLQGVCGTNLKRADPALAALLANGQRLRLVQAFARIEDAPVQQALLALTELLARLGAGRRALKRRG